MKNCLPNIALFSLLFIIALLPGCGDQPTALATGAPPPGFEIKHLNGDIAKFPNQFKDKVVVIRFWADWCPFCKSEMKAIGPLYEQYKNQGLVILAINVRQDVETVKKFVEPMNIDYDILLDEDGAVARKYGVSALPITFFIDRQATLNRKILGESTPELLEQIIVPLLK